MPTFGRPAIYRNPMRRMPISLYMPDKMLSRLDRDRKQVSRAMFIRNLIERQQEGRKCQA